MLYLGEQGTSLTQPLTMSKYDINDPPSVSLIVKGLYNQI